MLKMIRQFTFHHPKQIIAPTLWLFLSQAFSILPAILAYMAIYLLGQAFYPPYTLDIALLIKIAVIGIAYVLLQYVVELISYYNTYGRAYGYQLLSVGVVVLSLIGEKQGVKRNCF